jgi:hypothetical protein
VPRAQQKFMSDFSQVEGRGYAPNGMSKFSRILASGVVREPHLHRRDISNLSTSELIEREENAVRSLCGRLAVQSDGPVRDRMLADLRHKRVFLKRLHKDAKRFATGEDPTPTEFDDEQ